MKNKNKSTKSFIKGALLGLVFPILGLFVGLQVLPIVGNILLFPIVLFSLAIDTPFGMFSTSQIIIGMIISSITWGICFIVIDKLINNIKSERNKST